MAKNSGKPTEDDFEDVWSRLGKRAWCFRLMDAAEVRGRTGKIGTIRSQPSDYVLVFDGQTEFAEVKSSQDETAFRFSLLREKQSAAATMILAAGGSYVVYARRLKTGTWFRFSYDLVKRVRGLGLASIKWSDLKEFEWTPPNFST